MRRTILILTAALILTGAAMAQSGATISVDAFATTNNVNTIRVDNLGFGLRGSFCYEKACIGGEGLGNDGRAARSRYWGSYDVVQVGKLALTGGGGFWRFGNVNGGFGQAGIGYGRFNAWGRYGNKDFTEAEGSFQVIKEEHFGIAPFYRFTRHSNLAPEIHSAGLRLILK